MSVIDKVKREGISLRLIHIFLIALAVLISGILVFGTVRFWNTFTAFTAATVSQVTAPPSWPRQIIVRFGIPERRGSTVARSSSVAPVRSRLSVSVPTICPEPECCNESPPPSGRRAACPHPPG